MTQNLWQQFLDDFQHPLVFTLFFQIYLADTYLIRQDNDTLTVAVASEHHRRWIESRLLDIVERQLVGIAGRPVKVQFIVQKGRNYDRRMGIHGRSDRGRTGA